MLAEKRDDLTACALLERLQELRDFVQAGGQAFLDHWEALITREAYRPSARNLAYYLALRQRDLRPLQESLMPWGLSSLGRSEDNVMETLDSVIATLNTLCHLEPRPQPDFAAHFRGSDLLQTRANNVLGPGSAHRRVRIMVTFPPEAAESYDFVLNLMQNGMNCARINCAHDSADAWESMIEHVRRAETETGQRCKIFMDLAGPKIRTEAASFPKKQLFNKGDTVLLVQGEPQETPAYPHQVSCNFPAVFEQVQPGQSAWFDDGKLGTVIEQIIPEGLVLRVTQASSDGTRIRLNKGVNFPDTHLDVSPLTEKDLQDLDFVAANADMIGYSFVQEAGDIRQLQEELRRRVPDRAQRETIAVVAKIETQAAVTNLPEIIVQAAGEQPFGVMIARGDLAVEIGFDRLAEMQEQILWICEAAHVPVIWATQVFENFVKTGMPTRAEVTDAAMSERAECVMLNKGYHIVDAVKALNNVLVRMESHQFKKTPGLRRLRSWQVE